MTIAPGFITQTFWPVWGRNRHDRYPLDLDGSEKFTRPKTGIDYWPTHSNADNFQQLGMVSGFMPEMDTRVWGAMWGRNPFGPISNPAPVNLQWQITPPGLSKQQPQS